MNAYVSSGSYLVTPCKREHQSFVLVLYPAPPLTFLMASQLNKDDYVYDIDNITALMASMDAASLEAGGARPRKSKRLAAKSAGKAAGKSGTSKQPPQLPPPSSTDSLLELEKLKNQNLKMELESSRLN